MNEPEKKCGTCKPRVYLAGGLTTGWQDAYIKHHPEHDCFDPRVLNTGFLCMNTIAAVELEAIRNCDEVYAYLEESNPSGIGLAFECGYARAIGKPVSLVDEKDQWWLRSAIKVAQR